MIAVMFLELILTVWFIFYFSLVLKITCFDENVLNTIIVFSTILKAELSLKIYLNKKQLLNLRTE